MLRLKSNNMQPYWSASAAGILSPIPTDNLKLWLKADAITGLSDGDYVSTWADSSSSSNNATGSGTARPTYKTAIQNNLPVARFDGSDDIMVTATNSFVASYTQHATIFVAYVTRSSGGSPGRRVLSIDSNTNDYAKIIARGEYSSNTYPTASSSKAGAGNDDAVSISGIGINIPLLAIGVWDGANVKYYQNGTLQSTATHTSLIQGATVNTKPWVIGSDKFNSSPTLNAQVDVCEVIIYNTDLSDALRGIVQDYLNAKWAIY